MTYQDLYDEQNKFRTPDWVTVLILILAFFILTVALAKSVKPATDVDDRTKELCREYAARDHEKEIAPERYKKLGRAFFDNFNWYQSCIDHTLHPVAK